MIVIVGGPDDEESAAIQMLLEQRSVQATAVDVRNLSTVGAVSVGLANAGLIDGAGVYAEDITSVWLGRRGASLCGSALDDLWDSLDVPVLPALPCVINRALDKKRQGFAANEVGFATDRRVNARDEISVAVIGDKVFAVSHRYDTVYALPRVQRGQCKSLLSLHGLECAVIQFAVTHASELVFRGMDPLGDYMAIENVSALPVYRAIVDLLTTPKESFEFMDRFTTSQRCHPANMRLKLVRH